jgi:hypothetical protein
MVATVPVTDDAVMRSRRWVIIGVGVAVAAGLAVAAVLFGLRGVEVASWLAGIAGLMVAVAAVVLAPSASPPPPPPAPRSAGSSSAMGERSISAGGDISGIASTGDNTTNEQHR